MNQEEEEEFRSQKSGFGICMVGIMKICFKFRPFGSAQGRVSGFKLRCGQALIPVVLLMFAAVNIGLAMMVLSRGLLTNHLTVSDGVRTLNAAESGLEDAFMQLLRNPAYPGGSLTVDGVDCTVTVTGTETDKTVVSECLYNRNVRTMQATVVFSGGVMTVSEEGEI
jgi:hypothetical protein